MKQVVQDIRSGATSVVEVPIPQPAPGTALVRTAASVVSAGTERALVSFASRSLVGKAAARPDLVRQAVDKARREGVLTTLEAVRSRMDQPMPLGYSSAGTVVATGDGLRGFRVGDRVACGGGEHAVHAEYAVVPQNLLAHLPEEVDFEAGAFATLTAIALHAFRLGGAQVGERVALIGLGLLGQLALRVARAGGCSVFGVDVEPSRLEIARRDGATAVVRREAEAAGLSFTQGVGFDLVLICADTESSDPVELAGALARDRARVVVLGAVGLEVPRRIFYAKELSLIVSRAYGPGRYDASYEQAGVDYPIGYVRWTEGRNLEAAVGLMAEGRLEVKSLITHRLPIERAEEAYRLIRDGNPAEFLGVVLTYAGEAGPERVGGRVLVSPTRRAAEASVRLGVIGSGDFARTVALPALRHLRGVQRVGVASARGLTARHAARRFGFEYAAGAPDEVLNDDRINSVAILTRHDLHASLTSRALARGKHVFCEKPLALNRAELAAVAEALRSGSGLLAVGYNRRFSPLGRALKSFLGRGIGPWVATYRVNAGALPEGHWLNDPLQGGRIVGEACHFIDLLTYLVGSLPARVIARALDEPSPRAQENVLITIDFRDGSLGHLAYVTRGERSVSKERLEVFGGGRAAILDDFRRLETAAGGRRRVQRSRWRQDKGHQGLWKAFVEAISSGGPPPIPAAELFAVSLATFAALESLQTGEPVDVGPLPPV